MVAVDPTPDVLESPTEARASEAKNATDRTAADDEAEREKARSRAAATLLR